MKNRDFFAAVNMTAQTNIEKALGMIDAYNMLKGTKFFLSNRRVTYKTCENGVEKNHDAWATTI